MTDLVSKQPSGSGGAGSTDSRPRKGLAIASLVMGIVNILTLSLGLVGALAGIVIGSVALRRANRQPLEFSGRKMAIVGVWLSAVSPVIGLLVAIFLPSMITAHLAVNEVAAITELRDITVSEATFKRLNGRYGSIEDLRGAGLTADRVRSGYQFNVRLTGNDFEVTAVPTKYGKIGTGITSYYTSSSDNLFRKADKKNQEASSLDDPVY
ncbi:MAG TPA: DUF4190 domain-containing protein [Blastocatellia bacterium]|nr:DUF4190 domain-containing protein [Blastocatellia bacterium]